MIMQVTKDSHLRSVIKGVTWRLLATATTVILVLIFTGEIIIALEVGFFEVIAKIIFYYLHERGWNLITWGKEIEREDKIERIAQ
jgi:uncharacterized membrane protein